MPAPSLPKTVPTPHAIEDVDVHEGGLVVVRDRNLIPDLIKDLGVLKTSAVNVGLEELFAGFEKVYQTDGLGTWEQKSDEQRRYIRRHGGPNPAKLMSGLTGILASSIEARAARPKYSFVEGDVGWGTDIHPDPGLLGTHRSAPMPTLGQLAAVHEFGLPLGGTLGGEGSPWNWTTGGGGSLVRVPARRWPTLAADRFGDDVTLTTRSFLSESLARYNSLPPF